MTLSPNHVSFAQVYIPYSAWQATLSHHIRFRAIETRYISRVKKLSHLFTHYSYSLDASALICVREKRKKGGEERAQLQPSILLLLLFFALHSFLRINIDLVSVTISRRFQLL